ncbi:MAG: hypothetical protein MK132_05280 [Lentisphaerales bacterium]|nr:hypothetical protein [Lentisphaerales bacterium]
MKKSTQFFTDEYLKECQKLTFDQILEFQENYRKLYQPSEKSKAISVRVPENLLSNFKGKCSLEGTKYQRKIKDLMNDWVKN